MLGQAIASCTSATPSVAPAFSRPGALGTQLGICDEHIDRQTRRLVMHQLDARQVPAHWRSHADR